MGLLSGDAPEFRAPQLNPETQRQIDEFKKQNIAQTPQGISGQQMQGVAEAAGSFAPTQEQLSRSEQALGGQDSGALYQALSNRYKANTGHELAKLKMASDYSARVKQFANTQEEAGYSLTLDNFARQNLARQRAAEFEAEASRNAVISSILGVAGVMGGMAIANKGQSTMGTTTPSGEQMRAHQSFELPEMGSSASGAKYKFGVGG